MNERAEQALEQKLGHVFKQPGLLRDALTHPSLQRGARGKKASFSPYERLEFLGDRVLGLVMAAWLYELFPEAKEGELAKRHAALVSREALQEVAEALALEKELCLARGEEPGADRKNLAALSDATEAVIGALYLDGGLEVASQFIHRHWEKVVCAEKAPADSKTSLQEWAQGRGLPLPAYKVVSRSGPPHAPRFEIEVSVVGFPAMTAKGDSKREAEKAAARLLLQAIENA